MYVGQSSSFSSEEQVEKQVQFTNYQSVIVIAPENRVPTPQTLLEKNVRFPTAQAALMKPIRVKPLDNIEKALQVLENFGSDTEAVSKT
jgi:hypothetical protein